VLSGYRETSDATYRGEILEDELESGLPLPPYSLLFSRPQRVIMALLLQCQTNGAFQQSDLMLTAKLPKPFGEYNQTSQMCPVKFPQGWVDDEWAEWFLEAMDPQRDAGVPANYDDAIALQDIGKLDFQPDELGLSKSGIRRVLADINFPQTPNMSRCLTSTTHRTPTVSCAPIKLSKSDDIRRAMGP
jgi:hypothetical protein